MHTVSGAKDGRKRFPFSRIKDQLVVLAVKSNTSRISFLTHISSASIPTAPGVRNPNQTSICHEQPPQRI